MEKGTFPRVSGQHFYKGFLMHRSMPQELLEYVEGMDICDDDCAVIAYRKSGTTWVGHIVWLILNNIDFDAARTLPLSKRFIFIEHMRDLKEVSQKIEEIEDAPHPRLLKTHLPLELAPRMLTERPIKVVLVLRNPKDTMVSLYHFYRMNPNFGLVDLTWSDFFEMYISGHMVSGDWFDWTLGWWTKKLDNPNYLVVMYEDLKANHREGIRKIAEFLGKNLSLSQVEDIYGFTKFDAMKSNSTIFVEGHPMNEEISPFFRKGQVADWKNYFTVSQNDRFNEHYEKKLKDVADLAFTYE